MDINFKKQLMIDFSLSEEEFTLGDNVFTNNEPTEDFLFYNRSDFSLICVDNRVFMRSENRKLIEKLKTTYRDYPGQWFSEAHNIRKLSSILADFAIEIDNFFPLMTYSRKEKPNLYHDFVRIYKEDIEKFKNKSKMCFCFDDDDRMGLAFYDRERIIALAGASQSGKYLWDIGLEKFYFDQKYKGVGTEMLIAISQIIKEENPDISPFTSTQFSHSRSINTAIRAGFEMNLLITARKK